MTFEELYEVLVEESVTGEKRAISDYDPQHLDCLLHPEKYPPVIRTEPCENFECDGACSRSCIYDAITHDAEGNLTIDAKLCVGCSACIEACDSGRLTESRDILPTLKAVRDATGPVYAMIAPAFIGQFSDEVTPGKLRSAFKALGFFGMVEVALFADILTMKEALEFDANITSDSDYQLTSCCCPMWIAMIRKVYNELIPHVPGAVSPMVACGRVIKALHPNAITVFIGPCLAKKSEAREPDVADAVDFVLTFKEVSDIFAAANIKPELLPESEKNHSSRAGIIYARAGGVSEAVKETVERINPNRKIKIKTCQADGVPQCREMIAKLKHGEAEGNFFEGMGCVGGCVGGPKAVIDRREGADRVNEYADAAAYKIPPENPYVIELLRRLGFETVKDFLEKSDMFTRHF